MKKPAVFLAGGGSCALAVASCSTAASSPTPAPQSDAGADSAQSAPGAAASPMVDPDTALTSKNGQSGPSAQSGQDTDTSVIVIVQLEESADSEATLASINEAVAGAFRVPPSPWSVSTAMSCAATPCACQTGRLTLFER